MGTEMHGPHGRKGDKGRLYLTLERMDKFIETHPASRLCGVAFAIIGGIVLIATAMQIYLDYGYRQEDRIARNWEVATRHLGGNTGKGEALSFLIANGSDLTGIDLSCERMGGVRKAMDGDEADERSICIRGAIVEGLKIPSGRTLKLWNLDGATLVGVNAAGSRIEDVELSTTRLSNGNLTGSVIHGCYDRTQVSNTTLMNARMVLRGLYCGEPANALSIIESDISGLIVENGAGKRAVSISNYAWADMPGIRTDGRSPPLEELIGGTAFCDVSKRPDSTTGVFAVLGTKDERAAHCNLSAAAARELHPDTWVRITR